MLLPMILASMGNWGTIRGSTDESVAFASIPMNFDHHFRPNIGAAEWFARDNQVIDETALEGASHSAQKASFTIGTSRFVSGPIQFFASDVPPI